MSVSAAPIPKPSVSRHVRALKWTLLLALFLALPLGYLGYLYKTDVTAGMGSLGNVPEFYFNFANRQGGFTHFDTKRQVTLVAILGDACREGCEETVHALADIRSFIDENLTQQHKDVATPLPIRLVAMGPEGGIPELSGWDTVHVSDAESYLKPSDANLAESPAVVVIDDAGRYRSYLPLKDPANGEILRRLTAKITSHQFLIHYLVKQTLMWEKARGKRS